MKKTYMTPTLAVVDDIVHATLSGQSGSDETANQDFFKIEIVGGVGYYL